MNNGQKLTPETVRRFLEMQRLGNIAVRKAQAENRRLGIPNWYSINGVLVSDQPRDWGEVAGVAPHPLTGEDAQDWVSRTRAESDEREQQWRPAA
jgi:hypothetical protein